MKQKLTTTVVVAITALLMLSGKIYATGTDTLVVYANGPSLDQIINSDTTSSGMQAHSAYKLVSLDTTYIYLAPVTVKSNITVIGVLGSDGRPPCIQPGVLSDGSIPSILFNMNGKGTIGVFKNLYIFDLAIDGSFTGTRDFLISADNVKFYLDNTVCEENHYEVIAFSSKHDDFYVTNCKFRNGVDPKNWFGSSILACDYPSNTPADSIVMKYNTFLCVNSRAVTTGNDSFVNYFDFSHNSYIYNFTEDLRMFTVTNGKFDNNIFYGLYAGAQPVSEYPIWFEVFSPETNSIIDFDTLTTAMDSVYDPADVGKTNLRMLAEAKRNIEVKNNVYFWPKKMTDFWTAWDDTAHGGDSLYTAPWMNDRTKNMFNDKTHWPNLVASGNQNVDPGFGTSILDVVDNAGGTQGVIGLLQYVTEIRTGKATTNVWGYLPQSVTGSKWIPQWPLPETSDMQYSNTSLKTGGTDGQPVGDPGWFNGGYTGVQQTAVQSPNKFELYQAYPNPFNPTTTIKFSIANEGKVSLEVYNIMGQLVKTIIDNATMNKGEYNYTVNMDNYSSGVYFYTLRHGENIITKKMVLLK